MIDNSIHPNSRIMIDAWRRMRANPSHNFAGGPRIREHPELVSNIFVIQSVPDGAWPFRTTGDQLERLLGRDLRDQDFRNLWSGPDKEMVSGLLQAIRVDGSPGLLRARGESLNSQRVDVEITLMPLVLSSPHGVQPRFLGLYQPLGGESLLKGRPVWSHRLSMIVPPEARAVKPKIRLVSSAKQEAL